MRYPDFTRVPLSILVVGLVVCAICRRLDLSTLLYLLDFAGGLIWLAILMCVVAALLQPRLEVRETRYDRRGYRNP